MLIRAESLQAIADKIFRAAGSAADEAEILAQHLVEANLVGHDSHGIIRLPQYIEAVHTDKLQPNRRPKTVLETAAMLVLDGQLGYGQIAAHVATDLAIAKARTAGVALLTLSGGGHFGRMGAWAERAAASGQATIYFANAARRGGAGLAPFGGTDRRIHAGPICLGMPAGDDPPIVLDMSTSAVAIGKIRLARNQGSRLRELCLVGTDGVPTNDPAAFFANPPAAAMPFGGHKGFGLSVFTDLFGGILGGGGADYTGDPVPWYPTNSMLAVHIDLAVIADPGALAEQVRAYADWVRQSPPQPGGAVLMPGERGRQTRAQRSAEGIPLDDATWTQILAAAASCGIAPESLEA